MLLDLCSSRLFFQTNSIFICFLRVIVSFVLLYNFVVSYPGVFNFLGSVIKNQLVTHLTLGIALRAVLDALRKPADSKVCTISYQLSFIQFLLV